MAGCRVSRILSVLTLHNRGFLHHVVDELHTWHHDWFMCALNCRDNSLYDPGDVYHLVDELQLGYFKLFLHFVSDVESLHSLLDFLNLFHLPRCHDRDMIHLIDELQLWRLVCHLHLLNRGHLVLHCMKACRQPCRWTAWVSASVVRLECQSLCR